MNRRDSLRLMAGAVSIAASGRASSANPIRPATTQNRGYATGPFGLVHYQDTGGDGAPLLLCHQAPQTSRQFDSVLPELATRGIRAIAIDTPGFGMSDAPTFVPRIEDYAPALLSVLDHLHMNRSHLLGHHAGAAIVAEASLQFPKRVLSVILNGPHPMNEAERRASLENNVVTEQNFVYETDGSHLLKSFKVRWALYGPGADPKITTRVVAEKFIGYGPFWYGHHAADTYDFNAALPRMKHKTLILTNTGDLVYAGAQVARLMRPDFGYVELPGGTIDIMDQQPAAWADAVSKFLRA